MRTLIALATIALILFGLALAALQGKINSQEREIAALKHSAQIVSQWKLKHPIKCDGQPEGAVLEKDNRIWVCVDNRTNIWIPQDELK